MLSILVAAGARGVVRRETPEGECPRGVLPARTTWGVPTRPSHGRLPTPRDQLHQAHVAGEVEHRAARLALAGEPLGGNKLVDHWHAEGVPDDGAVLRGEQRPARLCSNEGSADQPQPARQINHVMVGRSATRRVAWHICSPQRTCSPATLGVLLPLLWPTPASW
jgi:hypothetical protein